MGAAFGWLAIAIKDLANPSRGTTRRVKMLDVGTYHSVGRRFTAQRFQSRRWMN